MEVLDNVYSGKVPDLANGSSQNKALICCEHGIYGPLPKRVTSGQGLYYVKKAVRARAESNLTFTEQDQKSIFPCW